MIIRLKHNIDETQANRTKDNFEESYGQVYLLELNSNYFIVAPDLAQQDSQFVEEQENLEQIVSIDTGYKLCTRQLQAENTIIDLGDDVVFGTNKTVFMGGPCAVESETQVMKTAEFLCQELDLKVMRGGAFKPRTSPYSFQGMGIDGLEILNKVKQEFGLKIITEVKDNTHFDEVADVADIVQVGTKSMYNFSLLQMCGKIKKPVMLKRGFMSTVQEYLQAVDAIMLNGNAQVILCERGIRTFEPAVRFCLDLCSAILMKELSHLPLVIDPSHAVGVAAQVPQMAQAAAGLGIDGLLVELHPNPPEAKCDSKQALTFEQTREMLPVLSKICSTVEKEIV